LTPPLIPGRLALLATLLLCAAAPLGPYGNGLPGVGKQDRRVSASVFEAPWRSVVRITSGLERSCTGVIFAPDEVATAAHCLHQPVTGAWARPQSIHVLIGYLGGDYLQDARVAALHIAPGYTPQPGNKSLGLDVAILTLAAPQPASNVVTPAPAQAGMHVTFAGFGMDRLEHLMADPNCAIIATARDADHNPILIHSCEGTLGTSGAPLFNRSPDGVWHVVGIQLATHAGQPGGIAAPLGGR
jgi:protease YdgD